MTWPWAVFTAVNWPLAAILAVIYLVVVAAFWVERHR